MTKKRRSAEEIVSILREADKAESLEEIFRKHGIAEQTFYRWKKKYGGLGTREVRRLRILEDENSRLKRLAGEQALVIQVQKEHLEKRGWA